MFQQMVNKGTSCVLSVYIEFICFSNRIDLQTLSSSALLAFISLSFSRGRIGIQGQSRIAFRLCVLFFRCQRQIWNKRRFTAVFTLRRRKCQVTRVDYNALDVNSEYGRFSSSIAIVLWIHKFVGHCCTSGFRICSLEKIVLKR